LWNAVTVWVPSQRFEQRGSTAHSIGGDVNVESRPGLRPSLLESSLAEIEPGVLVAAI
jgi:hypothetical protein